MAPNFAPVTGHFAYDTNSMGVPVTGGVRYVQNRYRGFVVTLGTHEFRADDYAVSVFNNRIISGSTRDQVAIKFDGRDLPPSSLFVDGVQQTMPPAGLLTVTFNFPQTLLSDALLPTSLSGPLSPPASTVFDGLLGDASPLTGQIDTFFIVDNNSLAATTLPPPPMPIVPEPTSAAAIALGLVIFSCSRLRFRRG